jgi:hypothetical protein
MSNGKITYERIMQAIQALAVAAVSLAVIFGWVAAPAGNEPTARGVTNFDSLTLSDDLVVGDDATITGDLDVTGAANYGADNLYSLLINDSSEQIYVGRSTFTGTLAITTTTHGLSAITAAFCTLAETPATGAGDGALCWVGVSGTTATITVEQDDWTTNAGNSTAVHYAIVGNP